MKTAEQLIEILQKFPGETPVIVGESNRNALFANGDEPCGEGIYDIEEVGFYTKKDGFNRNLITLDFNSGDFNKDGEVNLGANFPDYIARISKE